MPIYEYHCRACGKDFELMRSRDKMDTATKCLHCASKATKRKLSIFAPVRVAVPTGADAEHDHDHADGEASAEDDWDDCC